MTLSQRIIVVYGATGTQGFAVASSLLKSRQGFRVRAVTRNPQSEKAQKLAELGAEVVKADGHNDDDMKRALADAWGFWLNTHHHDPAVSAPGGPTDEDLGRRLVTLAAAAGVKVFIYSTCESPDEMTNSKTPVEGMDAKHRVEMFARGFKEFDAVIGAFPGWYFENFISPEYAQAFGGFPIFPDKEGYYTLTTPAVGGEGNVPTIAVAADFGEMIHGMFLNPEKYRNRTIQCVSDTFTFGDAVKAFTEITGKKARYVEMDSCDDFPTGGSSVLIELQNIFKYTQHQNGWFFGVPEDFATCQSLKDEARRDKGLPLERTMSLKQYFVQHYGKAE